MKNRQKTQNFLKSKIRASPAISSQQSLTLASMASSHQSQPLLSIQMGNEETLNLDDDYMTGDEMDMDEENQNEEQEEVDSLASTAENLVKGKRRRKRSQCWKTFRIIGSSKKNGVIISDVCSLCDSVF
ncbi:predicted protein [Arabidopsis lyrata subsp. lyrata]|uniref:Predicted protein n=1 Tax=Arabidopsis lyrata subsp. lyrata TaxID=81972 RepID=D7L6C0_ARALL|nr:predicted protein [Arabidopsis lyrata subsp. lyrata]